MFQIFFVSKYLWVLEAVIFGTLLPEHPVFIIFKEHILGTGTPSPVAD